MSDFVQGGSVVVGHMCSERLAGHEETTHTDHTVSFCVRGSFRMVHGETIEVGAGAVTLVPAGVPHEVIDGSGLELRMLSFCATCLSLDETQSLMNPFRRVRLGALPYALVPEERRGHLTMLFEELTVECGRSPIDAEVMRSLVVLILREIRAAMPGDESAADAKRGSLVADALAFIQGHCLESISLKDVASAIGKAPAHVAATVKKATGYSVGQWISDGRLSEACVRLAHTDDTVEEIGYRVGWKDSTNFIRQFRKAFDQTPAQWRKDNRPSHDPV